MKFVTQGRPNDDQCLYTTAQVSDPLSLVQNKEEHYQIEENTLSPRCNPP